MAKSDILLNITDQVRNKDEDNKIDHLELAQILEDTVNEIPDGAAVNNGITVQELLNVTIDASELNFGGANPPSIELIPFQEGKMIMIHSYFITYNITGTLEQSYSQVYLGYNLIASGYPQDITTIPVDNVTKGFKVSSGVDVSKQFNNDDESIINAPIYLRGEDGIGYSGIAGEVNIQISYSYIDYPFPYTVGVEPPATVISGGSDGAS